MNWVLGSGRMTNPAGSSAPNRREEAAVDLVGHVLVGDAADEELRQPIWRQLGQPGPDLVGESRSDQIVGDLAVQHPVPGLGLRHHVGEQILKLEDLDTAVDHLGDEVEVVAAGLLQPDDVVEQQLVAVVRGEPLMGQTGRADHALAAAGPPPTRRQAGTGRVHALFDTSQTDRLPVAISATATTDVNATTATTDQFGFGERGQTAFPAGPQVERGARQVEQRRDQQVLPATRVDQPHRVAERDQRR